MKKLFVAACMAAILFSCNNKSDKGQFTITGDIKASTNQKIYLEQLYFSDKPPEVLDTGEIKNGKFELSAIAPEEGLYRIRTEDSASTYLINEGTNINFSGTEVKPGILKGIFSSSANGSLNKLIGYADSIKQIVYDKNAQIAILTNGGKKEDDSTIVAISNEIHSQADNFVKFAFSFADTAKSPVVSLFAIDMSPVEPGKLENQLAKLAKRFPNHKGIADALVFSKLKQVESKTPNQPPSAPTVGDMAPEITMNDVNDKPFSLSQLRGKYVLIDFWASWCGPCRGENPNVVAAFNQYKDKKFTVLGVSLDKNKQAWLDAIKEDKLTWQHISDLKYWSSAAAPLYGFDGIPYNVLIDPQGKIIATNLRESALQNKLAEVLK